MAYRQNAPSCDPLNCFERQLPATHDDGGYHFTLLVLATLDLTFGPLDLRPTGPMVNTTLRECIVSFLQRWTFLVIHLFPTICYYYLLDGSLCEWRSSGSHKPDDFSTFVQYRDAALQRVCDPPEQSATMTWTPDDNTPDLVYYQVCRASKAIWVHQKTPKWEVRSESF